MITTSKAALTALAKRGKLRTAEVPFKLEEYLFPAQLAFVKDEAPNKLAVCSRRSGKTISCAADLIHTAISNDEVVCLYITLSRNNAKKIIWKEIKKINRLYKLGGVENLSELSYTFPNGSIIYLSGAKDTNEIEKFRGLALKLVYIDESQSFREYIKELIDDVLAPALMDYAGTLCMIGTPGPVPTGYFHDAVNKENSWSKHAWTFFDNPFILDKSKKTHQEMLDRELKRRGVTINDPSIQREWYGKWVLDSDSLLIHYDPRINDFTHLPKLPNNAKWNYIVGIDIGMDDADAIAVVAWSEHTPATYLIEEVINAGQGLTELVGQIQAIQAKYERIGTLGKMVIDQGGLGKKLAEEMRRRHAIPVVGADKARKMEAIAFFNDALRTKRFMARSNSIFAEDSYKVEIDRDKSTPDSIKVSTKFHSDIIDAALYAFRESPAFTYESPVVVLKPGTKEWAKQQEAEMFETLLEQVQEQERWERFNSGGDID